MQDNDDVMFSERTTLADRVGSALLLGAAGVLLLALVTGTILTLWTTRFWFVTPLSFFALGGIAFAVLRKRYVGAFFAGVMLLSVNFTLGALATADPGPVTPSLTITGDS